MVDGPRVRDEAGAPLALVAGLLCDERPGGTRPGDAGISAHRQCSRTSREALPSRRRRAILDATPGRFSLAGLSMGGYVALEMMRVAPERVVRLALLDTSARADTPEQTATRRELIHLDEEMASLIPGSRQVVVEGCGPAFDAGETGEGDRGDA